MPRNSLNNHQPKNTHPYAYVKGGPLDQNVASPSVSENRVRRINRIHKMAAATSDLELIASTKKMSEEASKALTATPVNDKVIDEIHEKMRDIKKMLEAKQEGEK